MARQAGDLILEGKIGGLSFYISKFGPLVRTIGTVSKERFHNDPKLARRKAAALDFGYASSLGKLLRVAVGNCCPLAEVGTTNQRLNAVLRPAVKLDTDHAMGERRIIGDNAAVLQNFNWQDEEPVHLRVHVPLIATLDPIAGTASLDIDAIVPNKDLRMGPTVSRVDISLVIAAVTRETKERVSACDVAGLDVAGDSPVSISLRCGLPAGSGSVWIAGIGVQGYEEQKGVLVALPSESGFMILESGVV